MMLCESDGCYFRALWTVQRPNQTNKTVCGHCRDELVSVWGWRLVGTCMRATCPTCGEPADVYVRCVDDLVCLDCAANTEDEK